MSRRKHLPIVLALLVSAMAALPGAQQKTVQATLEPTSSRKPAPAFRLQDASGKTHTLANFAGTPVVLNLWATECGGCKAELPTFVELHRTYADKGLRVVGVSLDVMYEDLKSVGEAWARVTPFARDHDLRYTLLVDDGSVEKAYKVVAMPATYLIDQHGRIAATYVGVVDAANLKANVAALLSGVN